MSALPEWLAAWWRGNDTGLSSRTIVVALAENTTLLQIVPCSDLMPPSDTSDVGRCIRLLDLAEANGANWRGRLAEVVRVCPRWAPLLPRWAEIEAAYREDEAAQHAARKVVALRKDGTRRRNQPPVKLPPSRCWWLVATTLDRYDPYAHVKPHPFAAEVSRG